MTVLKLGVHVAGAALFAFMCFAVPAAAQSGVRQATTVTFGEPVQLPGVTLAAGTYLFERGTSGNRIEISGGEPRRVIAMLQVLPVKRAARGEVFTFRPSATGSAKAIAALYADKGKEGHEFMYTAAQQQALMTLPVGELARVVR